MKFSDEERRELISVMGLRVHIREAFKKVIKAEEKAALSQLHRRGLPNHAHLHYEGWSYTKVSGDGLCSKCDSTSACEGCKRGEDAASAFRFMRVSSLYDTSRFGS